VEYTAFLALGDVLQQTAALQRAASLRSNAKPETKTPKDLLHPVAAMGLQIPAAAMGQTAHPALPMMGQKKGGMRRNGCSLNDLRSLMHDLGRETEEKELKPATFGSATEQDGANTVPAMRNQEWLKTAAVRHYRMHSRRGGNASVSAPVTPSSTRRGAPDSQLPLEPLALKIGSLSNTLIPEKAVAPPLAPPAPPADCVLLQGPRTSSRRQPSMPTIPASPFQADGADDAERRQQMQDQSALVNAVWARAGPGMPDAGFGAPAAGAPPTPGFMRARVAHAPEGPLVTGC